MLRASALAAVCLAMVAGCGGGDSPGRSAEEAATTTMTASSSSTASAVSSGPASDHSQSRAEGSDAFDVCGLLTPADLEKAFASPFDAGEGIHLDQTGGDQCIWSNTDAPPVKQFSVDVLRDGHLSAMFSDAGYDVKRLFEETREYASDIEEIDLGDEAYLSGSTLAVLDGDTSYSFSTGLGTSPEAIQGLRTLAAQVVDQPS